MIPITDTAEAPDRWLKAQRELTSLLGAAVLTTILVIAIWAFTGAGAFWPVWVIGALAVILTAAAARAVVARPRRAARPSPDGPGA
jgi:membrane-bound metal-dependent hydrolase YbcI (DUF457 family)